MVKIDKSIKKLLGDTNRRADLVMQLHDELIYEVNEQDLSQIQAIIKDGMENCMDFIVKMKVKIRIGPNWGNLVNN